MNVYRDINGIDFIRREFITYAQCALGHFSTPSKMGTKKLYDIAVMLYPEGPPTAYIGWVVGDVCTVDDYVALASGLFRQHK